MTDEEKKAFLLEVLDVPNDQHFDRVARINARFVLAKGGQFYDENGYRNPDLLDGCNIVRMYLVMLAMDYGLDIRHTNA